MTSPCENCHEREGWSTWIGDGSVLDLVHGFGAWWCELCIVTAQLKYARERASEIPTLEARLAELQVEIERAG